MQPFKQLKVWQKADESRKQVELVCDALRRHDRKLAGQLRDAVAAIPAMISEGRGRATDRDFANFVSQAIGSCNEVENHLHRAVSREYISQALHDERAAANAEVRMMLFGLRRKLLGDG